MGGGQGIERGLGGLRGLPGHDDGQVLLTGGGAHPGQESAGPGLVREGLAGDDAAGVSRLALRSRELIPGALELDEVGGERLDLLLGVGGFRVGQDRPHGAVGSMEPVGEDLAPRGTPAQHVGLLLGAPRLG